MPVDTRDKRFSMIGLAAPFRRMLPTPNGGFDAADRQQLQYCYRGILFGSPSAAVVLATATYVELNAYTADYVETNAYTTTVEC